MPGYYVHFASSNQKARKNTSFIKGVEIPDLLKTYVKRYGIDGARNKYNEIKTLDMPDFSLFEQRVQEDEISGNGMHYGVSATPDIYRFWNSLTSEEQKNPFYRGYLWHLLTDLYAYQTLGLNYGLNVDLLHSDWDRINVYITKKYPTVELPKEIIDLNMVSYIDDNVFNYVNPETVMNIVEYLESFDIIDGDISSIISEIMNKVNIK